MQMQRQGLRETGTDFTEFTHEKEEYVPLLFLLPSPPLRLQHNPPLSHLTTHSFVNAEFYQSSKAHVREMHNMASDRGIPAPRMQSKRETAQKTTEKIGTEIILERYERGQVTGWQDEGWGKTRQIRGVQRSNSLGLYRSFWRVLRKYPKEAQPRLAKILRSNFKRNAHTKNAHKRNGLVRLGRKMLLKYIDQLRNFELKRQSHDPVERFLIMYAAEKERSIENLDFYPYTKNPQEMKPVKDIGFHMVYKEFKPMGSPAWYYSTAGMGRHVLRQRAHKRRLPKINSLRKDRGTMQARVGHLGKMDQIVKRHQFFNKAHRAGRRFLGLTGVQEHT